MRRVSTGCARVLVCLVVLGLTAMVTACDLVSDSSVSNKSILAPLVLEIRADHSKGVCLNGGDRLTIHFAVVNDGSQPFALESADTPVMDLLIYDSLGSPPIYSWAGQNPTEVEHRVEWQPHQSIAIDLVWQVPRKDYFEQQANIQGYIYAASKIRQFVPLSLCLGTRLHQ